MNWKQNWETIREYDEIKFDFFEGIAKISINRPEKHNAFTKRMWRDLPELIKKLEVDHRVRVIVFRGAGEASFSVGADIEELKMILGRARAKKGMFEGDLDDGELEIGQISGLIHDIKSAEKIVEDMVSEFKAAKEKLPTF
jgi:enoyl-CoA hydratase/carnithine racemase